MEPLPADAGRALLPLARSAIAQVLGRPCAPETDHPPWLHKSGISFVTLIQADKQSARAGAFEAGRALAEDVCANAVSAAFHHPSRLPLKPEEFETISLEVAVLSNIKQIATENEHTVLSSLRKGIDGLRFRHGKHSSIFLPEAWALYPTPEDFLAHLKYKAGMPPDFWAADIELRRFTATCWREAGP